MKTTWIIDYIPPRDNGKIGSKIQNEGIQAKKAIKKKKPKKDKKIATISKRRKTLNMDLTKTTRLNPVTAVPVSYKITLVL